MHGEGLGCSGWCQGVEGRVEKLENVIGVKHRMFRITHMCFANLRKYKCMLASIRAVLRNGPRGYQTNIFYKSPKCDNTGFLIV